MKYPKKFKVGKKKYQVDIWPTIVTPPANGRIFFDTGVILLATHSAYTGKPLSAGERDTAFWHETVHAILHDMGSRKNHDEAFVQGMARRLEQIVRTAEF